MVNPFSLKTFAELAERRAIPRENLAPICLSTELSDSSTNPHEKSSLSILLAEDNATNRRVICRFLERRGHRVVEASNGEEAVERFKENALLFDIILMDIQMPRMDGFEAAQMIRACEERRSWVGLSDWKRTPILALTADAMPSIQQAIADSGMDGVVLKPATPEQLLVAIRKACEKARSAPLHASNLNFINAARETSTSPAESQVDYFADLIDRLDKSLLDLRVPMTWVENDYVEMGRLIALSLRELPDLCLRGDTLIKMRDINGLAGLVHRAKASLNILGANSTVTVCQALLDTCIQGSLEEVSGLWSQLRQNCQQLRLLLLQVESILESVTAQHLRQASPACTTQTTAPESSARLTAST